MFSARVLGLIFVFGTLFPYIAPVLWGFFVLGPRERRAEARDREFDQLVKALDEQRERARAYYNSLGRAPEKNEETP